MNSWQKKYLERTVALMCTVVVISFASILFNGTLFFYSDSDEGENNKSKVFEDLTVGQPELRRVDKQTVWATRLSSDQKDKLSFLTNDFVKSGASCDISIQYCVLLADTQRLGVSLQYTLTAPSQLPGQLPWFGGFVNPSSGALYDLLGRAYLFQGEVENLVVIKVAD